MAIITPPISKTIMTLRARSLPQPTGATAETAAYRAYLRKVMSRVGTFRATLNGDQRVDYVLDAFTRLALITPDQFELPLDPNTAPPTEFVATNIRCSKGIAVLHWHDHDTMIIMEGAPSLAVGSKVRITYRAEETAKIRAASRAQAPWIHPSICVDVFVHGPGAVSFPKITASVLNAAFFTITTLKSDVDESESSSDDVLPVETQTQECDSI